jgi:mono/diheme cytochrome c family protein
MKRFSIVLVAMALMTSTAALAEDGAALYKAKCAGCHGAGAEGKMGPALKGKTDAADVALKGGLKGPHAKPIAGLNDEQAKAIGDYVASLK